MISREKYGEAHDPKHTTSSVKHCGGSVMVWACMAASGTGTVFIDDVTQDRSSPMNSEVFREILSAQIPVNAAKLIGRRTLPYDIKIVIAGNHELTFDQEFMADLIKQDFYYFPSASKLKPENYENVQSLLTNCIYLQDSEVTVRGFRIYGSPWRLPPGQGLLDPASLPPDQLWAGWVAAWSFLDWVPKKMQRVGCMELLNTVQRRVQPKLHVFGHIHEGYGMMSDGTTTFVNASTCTVNFLPMNPPIVFDLPNPRTT
uniref:Metallophosphoesterase domain containing 1 n=1 Tax=Oryzias sinensis TaxID=183150 RepID=A0A8C7XNG6_9TELE